VKLLDRYIRRHFAIGFVIAALVLVSVFSFLDFVDELDETTTGNYGIFDAIVFIVMTIPERALWLVPVCALLGSLIGLSLLDHGNELTVMRAAGMSFRQIGWSVLKTTGILLLIVVVFSQIISPALGERAWRTRALAIAGDIVLRKESGTNFWFRDGQRFISISDMVYGRIPTGIEIYEFDDQGELIVFTEAHEAHRDSNGVWLLKDVIRKRTRGSKIEMERLPELSWNEFLSPKQGAVIELEAESLAPTDLYSYAKDLRSRGQNADRYELTFWRKVNIPFATLAMVMISLPFVFGSGERGGIGRRVLLGAGVGVLFYLVDQVVAQLGLLVKLDPAITATAPAFVLFVTALLFAQRIR